MNQEIKDKLEQIEVKNMLFEKYLQAEIGYLESIDRTDFGEGSLNAFKNIKERWEALK